MKGEHHVYEKVDWSYNGAWSSHRRLFGLNEFAGIVTGFAMQKPGTDVKRRILPSHVFQLQCIVDSLTVSRGWSCNILRGHVLKAPSPGFRPRRDVDLFLDREDKRIMHGYLAAVPLLKQLFERDDMIHGDPDRNQNLYEVLEALFDDFRDFLGMSKYMYGLTTIPPLRFSNTNANGLWEYSPFLCGVGLVEGLELAYRINMMMWDRIPEPMLMIHLHNMLVVRGYITEPVGLYATLAEIFATSFFAEGRPPTSNFDNALIARLDETTSRPARLRRNAGRQASRTADDLQGILDLNASTFFQQKSNLLLYREAEWNPAKIPDADLSPTSMLGAIRLGQTKQLNDPISGKRLFARTDLVKRALARGMTDAVLLDLAKGLAHIKRTSAGPQAEADEAAAHLIPDGYTKAPDMKKQENSTNQERGLVYDPTGSELLDLLQLDIQRDVAGSLPLSGVNYVWITICFFMLFMQIEDKLKKIRSPLWVQAYEKSSDHRLGRQKRVNLAILALGTEDDECLSIMAEGFENPRAGFLNHIYWENCDLDTVPKKRTQDEDKDVVPECAIM